MIPFCAAVDWGTSRFRLWLLAEDGGVLNHISSNEGLQKSGEIGFEKILEGHLANLGCEKDLPVIICGMAGSRSGWQEAKYLDAPIELTQCIRHSIQVANPTRAIHILPGIAQRNPQHADVMRGEETQLLGMLDLRDHDRDRSTQIVCMPGTHSKWVALENDKLQHFATFMTGELFALLKNHSVLKMAVENSSKVAADDPVFIEHFDKARLNPEAFSTHLFSLRSSQLLGYASPFGGLAALSGCLIGLEFAGAMPKFGNPGSLVLLASGNLGDLYQAAFNHLEIETQRLDAEAAGLNGLSVSAKALWGGQNQLNVKTQIGTA